MPAKIPRPIRTRIRQMYDTGERLQSIADKLGLDRKTVAKYCDASEKPQVAAPTSPAAQLTADEVEKLQWVAGGTRLERCPRCLLWVTYLASNPAVVCPNCKATAPNAQRTDPASARG
jgi:DNA-binding CsgD family transcriptional regulator